MDLDTVMRRLEIIVGSDKQVDIVRWLGVNLSSINNWKRRGTVPYKAIVEALLARNISLDSFFAPSNSLHAPEALLLHETLSYHGKSVEAEKSDERTRILHASRASSAFLKRHGIEENNDTLAQCVELWLYDDGELMSEKRFQETAISLLKRMESVTSEA
ncbi:helix-turn-helix domain-containing protein [Lysobacter sp. N42]|uniref:helix-turn-helix domain-containing protein n=2 Tax=Gammaproteobacteria TaxID=1236 RepID=UPI001404A63D|nr:helix-turn-helix domain-containing protein [Lysobacter sp. N42]